MSPILVSHCQSSVWLSEIVVPSSTRLISRSRPAKACSVTAVDGIDQVELSRVMTGWARIAPRLMQDFLSAATVAAASDSMAGCFGVLPSALATDRSTVALR